MPERASKRRKLVQYPLVLDGQDCPSGKRTVRSKAEHLAVEQGKRVERANTLVFADFESLYHPKGHAEALFSARFGTVPRKGPFSVGCVFTPWDLRSALLEDCFNLVQRLTEDDYANSEMKWSEAKKKVEMRLPDLKYFILTGLDGLVAVGFISFMVTYEDGYEVLYIYEIHLDPEYQGKGLGKGLMLIAERTARNIGLEKVMLTVFRSNTRAIGFYERLGYSVDKYSPQPKILRNGTLKERSYVILSKILGPDEAPEYSKEAETQAAKAIGNARAEF